MAKYNLLPEQQQTLISDLQDVGQRILALTFSNPVTDQETIRHHAYLRGMFDYIKTQLEDKPTEESN
jgi:hypothetical protein